MSGLPWRTIAFFPDSRIVILPTDTIATDVHQPEALACELIKHLLKLGRAPSRAGLPRRTIAWFPESRIEILPAVPLSLDVRQPVVRACELIKHLLILR